MTSESYSRTAPPRRRRRKHRRRRRYLLPMANFLTFLLAIALLFGVVWIFLEAMGDNEVLAFNDTVAPRLYGVDDITVNLGDAVAYRNGVVVLDDHDPEPKLTVDSSHVDLSKAGTYAVTYTASDSAGNTVTQTASVTVVVPDADSAGKPTLNDVADQVLSSIITEGMTTRQQVEAIYAWARTQLSYAGHSDRTDWQQTAYTMLTERTGDCYGYFAVTKLLLQRLDIPNIDVQKVRNTPDDSDHFWSLVSVDGGKTYYHFDATPRLGDGDDFCLVTDAFLDAYSEAHRGSHNRDQSLYPATPEE